ncbi:MAG: putative fatty-acid--CoA ligase [Acidimicrobiia bacterium]|nr:putative fatty-acid--CoA ligase [Acidimicrobiia bacterium]
MQGLMQDVPLSITHIFRRAERLHSRKSIVTATPTGRERTTYGAWAERTRRAANALDLLGLSADARVGTFAWNTARHLELYFAAPCSGRVLHTINLRLFPEQITYIVNHAEDEVIFLDHSLVPLIRPLLPTFRSVRHLVVMNDVPAGGGESFDPSPGVAVHEYEQLLAGAEPLDFRDIDDENQAASMCYTSGTTGDPKGVLYSHRSVFLHTMGIMVADALGVRESDVVLPVVPMFHANAWGLAHAAVATGATLIMPGPDLSGPAIAELIESERVTVAAGVPAIWQAVLPALVGKDTSSLRGIPCGGSAVPKALSEAYRAQIGLPIMQAWGMTETSPVASCGALTSEFDGWTEEQLAEQRVTVGRPAFGVEARVVDAETGQLQPWDGQARGELQVRGPWIARQYYNDPSGASSFTDDGWLRTGDVATVDQFGYMRLVDRTKDLIKSGGEWISSVAIENELMGNPKVADAAVIGVPDDRWGERPLAVVVVKPDQALTTEEVREFLRGKVATWQIPDHVVFTAALPRTSVGKVSKKELRDEYSASVDTGRRVLEASPGE